jgi:3-hydroxyisobutyrate dehydrogenase-like beta-hydroxyacid dehydrogenase
MVMNLLQAGFEVSVFNRTKDKEAPFTGCRSKIASSLQELMETCDVVLTMLSNDAAVKEVFDQKVYCLQHLRKNHHQYEYGCTGNLALFKHNLQPTRSFHRRLYLEV